MNPLSGAIDNWTYWTAQYEGKKTGKICGTKLAPEAANGLVPMPQALKSLSLIKWRMNLLSGVIDNWTYWTPHYEGGKMRKYLEQNWLQRLLMVQFECPIPESH